jgi:Tfp pilus assembly protein PilF
MADAAHDPLPEDGDALAPDAAEHYNRALILIRDGNRPDAEGELRRAVAIRGDHAAARNNLGLLLLARGAMDEAIENFDRAIRARPTYARPYNNLGVAYLRLGKLDWAIAQFRRALLVDGDYEAARRNLGIAISRRQPHGEVLRDGRLALEAFSGRLPAGTDSVPGRIGRFFGRLLGKT